MDEKLIALSQERNALHAEYAKYLAKPNETDRQFSPAEREDAERIHNRLSEVDVEIAALE